MHLQLLLSLFLFCCTFIDQLHADSQLSHTQFRSHILNNQRDVWVYTPEGYSPQNQPYPLLIVFDGQAYVSELIPTPEILDRLIAEKKISPLVAVFVSSIDRTTRRVELPCYKPFADFLVQELLPWTHHFYHVTTNPKQTIVTGSSYGGLASVYAAMIYPQHFGNVLSQSGAFDWKPANDPKDSWITRQLELSPKLPIRFYLDAGSEENRPDYGAIPILTSNYQMRDLLQKKGYVVIFREFKGGHEYERWREVFPQALIDVMNSWHN